MDNFKQSGSSVFAKLNIDFEKVSLENLSHYVAVKYFLTEHDELPGRKGERYIESIHHLSEAGDRVRVGGMLEFLIKNSLDKTDHDFQVLSSPVMPESLHELIDKAHRNRYEEFYEEEINQSASLEETLLEILDALEDQDDTLCHYRYIYMALILALAVEPTIKAYLPNEQKIEKIWKLIINWFESRELPTDEAINQLFSQKSLGSQAIDEALDVFKNLLQVLNPANAKAALLEILDDCLEGYAICPGSQERRDLFNWWLSEVVTATWYLKFPENLY